MNENELDDILDTWHVPAASPSLRDHVRAGFTRRPDRTTFLSALWRWMTIHPRSLATSAAVAGVALLMMVSRADPQPAPAIPWTVDSEFLRYADDGSSSIEMYATSYIEKGAEKILARSAPSNPLKTAMWVAADAIGPAHDRIVSRLMFDQAKLDRIHKSREERASRTVGMVTGCGALCLTVDHFFFERATPGPATGCLAGTVVGRDTILGHPVTAFRERWTEHGRMTVWMAADLGCFALRGVYEAEQTDGNFHVVSEKRAVKITTLQ
jgi:hypothetical protein